MMKQILVIRAGAVGDFVLTLPLLEALRSSNVDAEVHILGYPHIAELVRERRLANKVHSVGVSEWAPLFASEGTLGSELEEWLRAFDRVICVWPDGDGMIRKNLAQAGCTDVLYVNPLPEAGANIHAIDFMARQCDSGGISFMGKMPKVFPNEKDTWWVERFMRVTGAGDSPLLGIHPGSGSPRKNWPIERCMAVVREWKNRWGGNVLMITGPAEEERSETLAPLVEMDDVFAMRNEALPRVAAALGRCDVFLGNDSGISHLAASAGTPVVAVFGPTDPVIWGPRGKSVSLLVGRGDVANVQVGQVLVAIRELLA